MKGNHRLKLLTALSSLGLLALTSGAHASGYRLEFQSASTLADAGEAAVVEDAGTNWYNSAGLVDLPQQYVLSAIKIYNTTKFTGTVVAPSVIPGAPPAFTSVSTGSATSRPEPLLPAIHYSLPLGQRFAFGISIAPAWGLQEQYGNNNSILQYDLVRIYTKTLDIAPSLAFRINQQWSVGAGPDFNYFQVLSKSNVNTVTPFTGPSQSRFSSNDWGKGFHAGILFHLNPTTRIGVNYRSRIVNHTRGYSSFAGPAGIGMYETNQFGVNFIQPAVTMLSAYHDINPKVAIMGTIAYDQWSLVHAYYGQNYANPPSPIPGAPQRSNVVSQQNMHNTFDLSIGTHVKLNDKLMLRGSLKYLPTPTVTAFRDVNNPDSTKFGINLGARYTMNKKLAFDFIYAHVFTKSATIHGVNPATLATANGTVRTHIDLIGAQLVWNI